MRDGAFVFLGLTEVRLCAQKSLRWPWTLEDENVEGGKKGAPEKGDVTLDMATNHNESASAGQSLEGHGSSIKKQGRSQKAQKARRSPLQDTTSPLGERKGGRRKASPAQLEDLHSAYAQAPATVLALPSKLQCSLLSSEQRYWDKSNQRKGQRKVAGRRSVESSCPCNPRHI